MVWVFIGIEVIALLAVGICYWSDKKEGKIITNVLDPIAMVVLRRFPLSQEKKENHSIYKILCQLTNEEEGEISFHEYRRKRLTSVMAALLFINLIWCGNLLIQFFDGSAAVFSWERPNYGEGDIQKSITLTLENGEELAEDTFILRIPEQEVEVEAAQAIVQEVVTGVRQSLQSSIVIDSLSLEQNVKGVSLFYESLTPQLLSSSGRLIGSPGKQRQEVKLRITGFLAGQSYAAVASFWIPAMHELTAKQKADIIVTAVKEGRYVTNTAVIVPTTTSFGDTLIWKETSESYGLLWLLLWILIPVLCLWREGSAYKQRMKDRQQAISSAYPEFINEMVILISAGLSLPSAWKRLGQDYQKRKEEGIEWNPLYEEVCKGSRELEGGGSIREVIERFTERVHLKEVRRLGVLLIQNLRRGDAFLVSRLRELNEEAWELRKKQVREKSEEVDTKLLLPLMLMLVVILLIVLAPAMISMQT